MSIKTRLAVSNILMILVPVCITVLIALGCLVFIWAAAVHGTGLGFEEKEDFFQASKGFTKIVSEALEGTPQAQKAHLEQLSKVLDESAVSLLILSLIHISPANGSIISLLQLGGFRQQGA